MQLLNFQFIIFDELFIYSILILALLPMSRMQWKLLEFLLF
jgi:hypothetical protein